MAKSRKKKSKISKKANLRSLPILRVLKEGLHLIGAIPNEIIAIVRKVFFQLPVKNEAYSSTYNQTINCKY